jgi:hypothetical protein
MSDDLFEFLVQEMGRAAQEAECTTERRRPAEIRSIVYKIKKSQVQLVRTAEVRACPTGTSAIGISANYTISAISR